MSALEYDPYYCEENVWRFLSRPELRVSGLYALFIFGASGSVAVSGQRAGDPSRKGLIFWDYHVAALDLRSPHPLALDFDSVAGFESPAEDYLARSFGSDGEASSSRSFRPLFRLVPASAFVERFDSDRSHMRRRDGSYAAPPPAWEAPACRAGCEPLRLADLIDPSALFTDLPGFGAAIGLDALRAFIGGRA